MTSTKEVQIPIKAEKVSILEKRKNSKIMFFKKWEKGMVNPEPHHQLQLGLVYRAGLNFN